RHQGAGPPDRVACPGKAAADRDPDEPRAALELIAGNLDGVGHAGATRRPVSPGPIAMKAFRIHAFGGPEGLRLDDLPRPTPGPGQVLVKIRAASLNYRDLLVIRGAYNKHLKLPAIPLSDGAGEVEAVGAGV